jgi:tetratricopeptide (TPR) repeat protein
MLAVRIKTFRDSRGMTQAQLAGDKYTKGFISLLETGRVGLSINTAEYLAVRLGVSVTDLLSAPVSAGEREQELLLVRAEAAFAAGRLDEALEVGSQLEGTRGSYRPRWLRLRGRIAVQTEHTTDAVRMLDEALRLFRAQGNKELAARTLYDLALAHARVEAHGEAVHYALQCENALSAGDVVDRSLELRVLSLLAGLFVTLDDLTSADLRIERAKQVAEDIADPRAVGNLYASLAIARQREGDLEAALNFAQKSLAAYEQLGVPAHVGNLWNTVGWIYTQRKQFGRAADALKKAAAIAADTKDDRLGGYVLQSQAELALERGDAQAALALADQSVETSASKRGRATSLLVRARALAAAGRPMPEMDRAFKEAIDALRPFGRHTVAGAHQAHFEALTGRGRHAEASKAAAAAFASLRSALT